MVSGSSLINMSKRYSNSCVSVYDIAPEVLNSITLRNTSDTSLTHEDEGESQSRKSVSPSPSSDSLVGSQSCSLCSLSFSSLEEQRSHLKSDFHNYNLKQKLRGSKPVSEDEFERLIAGKSEKAQRYYTQAVHG